MEKSVGLRGSVLRYRTLRKGLGVLCYETSICNGRCGVFGLAENEMIGFDRSDGN